jgi:hypothetical protein
MMQAAQIVEWDQWVALPGGRYCYNSPSLSFGVAPNKWTVFTAIPQERVNLVVELQCYNDDQQKAWYKGTLNAQCEYLHFPLETFNWDSEYLNDKDAKAMDVRIMEVCQQLKLGVGQGRRIFVHGGKSVFGYAHVVACVTWYMHRKDPTLDPRSAMLAVLDYTEVAKHADFTQLKPCLERILGTYRRTIVPAFTKKGTVAVKATPRDNKSKRTKLFN